MEFMFPCRTLLLLLQARVITMSNSGDTAINNRAKILKLLMS
jgi:hypothetical protein